MEKKDAASAPALHAGHLDKDADGFVCKVRFRNALPPVPFPPKLLDVDTTSSDHLYTQYQYAPWIQKLPPQLLLEPDLGMPLDWIDLVASDWTQPGKADPIDAADIALLGPPDVSSTGGGGERAPAAPVVPVGRNEKATWLRKTQYVAGATTQARVKKGLQQGKAGTGAGTEEGEDGLPDFTAPEVQLQALLASFEAARDAEPRHPSKPHLRAARVFPLQPDFALAGMALNHVVFPHEPMSPSKSNAKRIARAEERAERAMMRPLQAGDGDPYMEYFLPELSDEDNEADPEAGPDEVKYVTEREYDLSVVHTDADERQLARYGVYIDEEAGVARYAKMPLRLMTKKRRYNKHTPRPPPTHLYVSRRPLGTEDWLQRANQLALIAGTTRVLTAEMRDAVDSQPQQEEEEEEEIEMGADEFVSGQEAEETLTAQKAEAPVTAEETGMGMDE